MVLGLTVVYVMSSVAVGSGMAAAAAAVAAVVDLCRDSRPRRVLARHRRLYKCGRLLLETS